MAEPIVVITGPTASGKTGLVAQLASQLQIEVISADSVQVYRGFDIGSAKPSHQQLAQVPHHLISACDATEKFDAGSFCTRAKVIAGEIRMRGHLPVVVGGTGLYIQALLSGMVSVEIDPSEGERLLKELEIEIRANVIQEEEFKARFHQWLAVNDPESAEAIEVNDLARMRRAATVFLATGTSLAKMQKAHGFQERAFDAIIVVLELERRELYRRIDERCDEMLRLGLIDEVRELLQRYSADVKPLGSLGYRHVVQFLLGSIGELEMVDELKRDTRRFAKRQLTWWRNQPAKLGWRELPHLKAQELGDLVAEVERFVQASKAGSAGEVAIRRWSIR